MKKYIYFLFAMMMLLPCEVVAQNKPATQQSAAKDAAQLKRERERAKAQAKRDKERLKREKERAKKQADKERIKTLKEEEHQRQLEDGRNEAEKHRKIREREQMLLSDTLTREQRDSIRYEIKVLKRSTDKARRSDVISSINFYFGPAYTGMLSNKYANAAVAESSNSYSNKFTGLAGGLVGFNYEAKKNHFLFNIGPEFRLIDSRDKIDFRYSLAHPDYPESMTQHYQSTVTKKDATKNGPITEDNIVGQVSLPVMFGGTWNAFYFLVGGKVGYNVVKYWKHAGEMTTSVTDNWAVDEWYNLNHHNDVRADLKSHVLYGGQQNNKNNFGLLGGLDLTASAEVGVNLDNFFSAAWRSENDARSVPRHMKLSFFADYGVLNQNVCKDGGTHLVAPGQILSDAHGSSQQITTNSIHQSQLADGHRLSSLMVGVKFTAQLQLTKPKLPDPYLIVQIVDSFTHEPIQKGARLAVHMVGDPRKPKMRGAKKDGLVRRRQMAAEYDLQGFAPEYLDGAPFIYDHFYDMKGVDTLRVALIPIPKLVVYAYNRADSSLIEARALFHCNEDTTVLEDYTTLKEDEPLVMNLHYGDTYRLNMSCFDYHPDSMEVRNLYDTVRFYLRPCIHVRHKLVLKHMYFAFDKVDILPESEPEIQRLYEFLTDNPKIRVQIVGHTDSKGSDAYNQRLSEGRANSLVREMIERGIDASRMEPEGRGESEPIDTNRTEAGRQNNRRIEVIVLNEDEAGEDIL